MNWEHQHNYAGDDSEVVDVVIFPRSGPVWPVNIVVITDCSASMRGQLAFAAEFVKQLAQRYDQVVSICAGDIVQICSPLECTVGASFNFTSAVRAAAGVSARSACNHVFVLTDDPGRIVDTSVSATSYLHVVELSAATSLRLNGMIAECCEFIAAAAGKYTAEVAAPDGVRIVHMCGGGDVTEIVPRKRYSIAFSAKIGAPSIHFRVSMRVVAPVNVRLFRDGVLEDTLDVDFDDALDSSGGVPADILPLAMVRDLITRAETAPADETISNQLDAIADFYPISPALAGLIAECRGVIRGGW